MSTDWIDVSDVTPRIAYTATASQTAFTVPFVFFSDEDLFVYQNDRLLTLDTHYTVLGAEDEDGGAVTLLTGATVGDAIMIAREVEITQTAHIPPSGPLDIAAINIQFSKLIAIDQQLADRMDRSIHLADSDTSLDMTLPLVAERADLQLGFDSLGNIIATAAFEPGVLVIASEPEVIEGASNVKIVSPLRLTQKLKSDGFLSARHFGITFDTLTDQTTAVLSALQDVAGDGGGQILVPPGRKITIGTSFIIPARTGLFSTNAMPASHDMPTYLTDNAGLNLTPGATIGMASNTTLRGLLILNPAITAAVSAVGADLWFGTAIQIQEFTTDHLIEDCAIFGYGLAVGKTNVVAAGTQRFKMSRCAIDCKAGVYLYNDTDVPRIQDVQIWPFMSVGLAAAGEQIRSGTGFEMGVGNDWGYLNGCFSLGHAINYKIESSKFSLVNCGSDYDSPSGVLGQVGYQFSAGAENCTMVNCRGASTTYGITVDLTSAATFGVSIINQALWSLVEGVYVVSGRAKMNGGHIYGGKGVSRGVVCTSANAEIEVENVTFEDLVLSHTAAASSVKLRAKNNTYVNATVGTPYLPTLASAATLAVAGKDRFFQVSGTVNISAIANPGMYAGETIVLRFLAALTMVHGASMQLAGSANFVTTASDIICMTSDGVTWYETSRTVI